VTRSIFVLKRDVKVNATRDEARDKQAEDIKLSIDKIFSKIDALKVQPSIEGHQIKLNQEQMSLLIKGIKDASDKDSSN
jgi:hypothetical protein